MAAYKKGKGYWTKSRFEDILINTMAWMKEAKENTFVGLYLIEHQDIGERMITYLLDKFKDDEQIVALWANIIELEKLRIVQGGMDGTYRENMTKFLLNCKFNFIPKNQQQIEIKGDNIKFDFGIEE